MARHSRTRQRGRGRHSRTSFDRLLQRWARKKRRQVGRWIARVGKSAARNWRTYHVSPPVSSHAPRRPGGRGRNRIRPDARPFYQPNSTQARTQTSTRRPRPARKGGSSMSQTVPLRKMPFPDAEAVKKGLYSFKDVLPVDAAESHLILWASAHLLAYHTRCVVDLTDTFVALNADHRIIVPMSSAADLIGTAAGSAFAAEKRFRELYAGEISQSRGNVRPMQYQNTKGRRAA